MKRFLILINLFLSTSYVFCQQEGPSPFSWFDKEGRVEYNLTMQFKGNEIVGICISKIQDDGIVGSVVNQFGIKAFDFKYNTKSKKVQLLNVISFMNKWYIKKTIKGDLKYLFSYPNIKKDKKRAVIMEGDMLRLENIKHQINYIFTPLTTEVIVCDEIIE